MVNIDSLLRLLILFAANLLLNGCTSSELSTYGLAKETKTSGTYDRNSAPLVSAFHQVCLSDLELPQEISDLASADGWRPAEDSDLELNGLGHLRKLVLDIPGGGGRFSEEQYLFSRASTGGVDILNIERRFIDQQTLATQCDAYGNYDFLKHCEALGKLFDKAPDHNQAYQHNGAHFIRWNTVLNQKNAVVSCDKTPNITSPPYEGISLSAKIDHTVTRNKMKPPHQIALKYK